MTGPLSAAAAELERHLARHAAVAGRKAPSIAVLGVTDALRAEPAEDIEHRARATVHLTADAVLIGPWGRACGQCLAMRWQRLRTAAQRDALETGRFTTATGSWPLITGFTATAVWAIYEHCFTELDDVDSKVARLDLETLQTSTVPLVGDPLCLHCSTRNGTGPPPANEPFPVALAKPTENTYRLRTPASYHLPAAALVNPVCGMLGAYTSTDLSSPVTAPVAGLIRLRSQAGLSEMTWSGKTDSFRASRDLAFLEGLERYAGTQFRNPQQVVPIYASYDDLGEEALDPRDCGEYAPESYIARPGTRPAAQRFDPSRPIPWARGHSLRSDCPILVPLRTAYYFEGTAADDFAVECSNGCAIGSSIEEAVLFGMLELIERDAFLLAWHRKTPLTEIDLDSCDSAPIRAMAHRAELEGYALHALDTRADLPIPVVAGLAVRRNGGPGLLSFAAAAAFDPVAAIRAALAETLTYIPELGRRVRGQLPRLEAMAENFDLVERPTDHSALFGLPWMSQYVDNYLKPTATGTAAEIYAEWQSQRPRTRDLAADLRYCRDLLVGAGFDVIVVDQTSPEQHLWGLRTARVIVPGLLPMDFGWSRQRALQLPRLRTLPGPKGASSTQLHDAELRLVPHPFS